MAEIDLETLSTPEHGYTVNDEDEDEPVLCDQDGNTIDTWREGYPYNERVPRDEYERAKRRLQFELLKLQRYSKRIGARHVILFEGRDAAGKGGTIQRLWNTSIRAAHGWWRSTSPAKVNKCSGISSATYPTCRPAAR